MVTRRLDMGAVALVTLFDLHTDIFWVLDPFFVDPCTNNFGLKIQFLQSAPRHLGFRSFFQKDFCSQKNFDQARQREQHKHHDKESLDFFWFYPSCAFKRARQEAHNEENKRARGQAETLPYPHLAKLAEHVLSGRHGLEVKTSGQARRSQWRTCSVDSQRNSGNQFPILEPLTLLVALYIHDIVVQNGELISCTWSRNIATKNIPLLVTDQSSDQFPSQQQRKNVDKRKKEKGLREMGAQWISEDQCADGKICLVPNRQPRTNRGSYSRMQWARCRGFGLLDAQR